MTTRLTLVCHGSTLAVRAAAFPEDEPLEPQALARVAGWPRSLGAPDRILTSPALRARQTAEALGLAATIDPDLRDCGYGIWAGRSYEEVRTREPDAIGAWMADPAMPPPDGESTLQLIARAARWLDLQRQTAGQVVAVTHPAFIRAAVVHAIGASPNSVWRIDVAPLSVTRLSGHDGRWNLVGLGPMPNQPMHGS